MQGFSEALRTDLIAVVEALREKASAPYVAMLEDLVHAARRDPALTAALRSHVETEELSPFTLVLRRAAARKQLPASAPTELVHETP